jgi:predicted small lipoprotein YifL
MAGKRASWIKQCKQIVAHVSALAGSLKKPPFQMPDEDQLPIDQDEEYKSSEDEDFNPDTVEAPPDEDLSSDEDDAPQQKKVSKKRKKAQTDAQELDSGDEATIIELRKAKKSKVDDDEDSGGEGGLIKTRAQRRAEYVKTVATLQSQC